MFASINNIDKHLYCKYKDFRKRNGFFIEAGANDGIRQSNTYFFEEYYNWSGILIEPIPKICDQCKINRNVPGNIIINAALVSDTYPDPKIILEYTPETYGLMSVAKGMKHTAAHLKKSGDDGLGVWCDVITLNKILSNKSYAIPKKIDLLSLDIEGYETQAILGCDFSKHYIEYIVVEEQYYQKDINNSLKKRYRKIDQITEHDFLWKRK